MKKLRQLNGLITAILMALALGYLVPLSAGGDAAYAAKKVVAKKAVAKSVATKKPTAKIIAPAPPRPKPAEIAERTTKPGLLLRATMGNGGPALNGDLVWTITPLPADPARPAIEALGPAPFVALAPSRYTITVRADDASATGVADVVAGPAAEFSLSVDAGRLAMQVLPSMGAMPLLKADLRVLQGQSDKLIGEFAANGKNILRVLPAGKFTLETRAGSFVKRKEIVISPGSTTRLILDLNIGYLRARAVAIQDGEPLAGAVFSIQPDTPAASTKFPATAMNGPAPVFVLAAGRYRLVARYGLATSQRVVAIRGNQFSEVTLNLMAGRIDVKVNNLTAPVAGQVDFLVSRPGGDQAKPIARYQGTPATMRLPQGDYEIVARLGETRKTLQTSIQPGEIRVVEFSLDQSNIARIKAAIASLTSAAASENSVDNGFATLRLFDAQSARIDGDIVWVVSTDKGVEIGRFQQTTPTAVLSPGRYLATAHFHDQSYQAAFVVETGRTTPVDLTVK